MRAHETLERAGRHGGFPPHGFASGLLAACPSDGSHDFYLSMMLDVPVPRVGTVKRHLSWLEGGRVVMEQRFRLRDGSPVVPRWRR